MTLVVARIQNNCIAIASDTLVVQQGKPLPPQNGVLKTTFLPGGIAVSFSGSPELANRAYEGFLTLYPSGASFTKVIDFFISASASDNNDYLVAFASLLKVVKIVEGRRLSGLASTFWIGDKDAYERFRWYAAKKRALPYDGRAVTAVLFADEQTGSPASNLYSTLSNVIQDREVNTVGGFAYVVSSRGSHFRQSVYSDTLFDAPENMKYDEKIPIHLGSSGENEGYSLSQCSPVFSGINAVAFYVLSGRKLFVFYSGSSILSDKCVVLQGVAPNVIGSTLTSRFDGLLPWWVFVVSGDQRSKKTFLRPPHLLPEGGTSVGFFVHANTYPRPDKEDVF